MSTTTEERTTEFVRIPWTQEMQDLARVLRSRGKDVPEGATVHLIPVPTHLRNADGLPLFRIAIVEGEQAS